MGLDISSTMVSLEQCQAVKSVFEKGINQEPDTGLADRNDGCLLVRHFCQLDTKKRHHDARLHRKEGVR